MNFVCGAWNQAAKNALPLRLLVPDISHDVPYLTVQDLAEYFDGVGADALVPLQPGDLGRADVIGLDERVLGDAFFLHHVPQVVIGNHRMQASLSACMLTEIDV